MLIIPLSHHESSDEWKLSPRRARATGSCFTNLSRAQKFSCYWEKSYCIFSRHFKYYSCNQSCFPNLTYTVFKHVLELPLLNMLQHHVHKMAYKSTVPKLLAALGKGNTHKLSQRGQHMLWAWCGLSPDTTGSRERGQVPKRSLCTEVRWVGKQPEICILPSRISLNCLQEYSPNAPRTRQHFSILLRSWMAHG